MKNSNAPEARKMEIATNMPTKKGMMEIAILIPSLPPSTNVSYVGTFFHVPCIKIKPIKIGIIHNEIVEMIAIISPDFSFFDYT